MNGEFLHSELIKECEAMQDVEAVPYYKLSQKIAADMCYRWMAIEQLWPVPVSLWRTFRVHFLNIFRFDRDVGVHRTDDRQFFITCVHIKLSTS